MKYILDFNKFDLKADFHKEMKETFDFPEYYGNNLDALWDLLIENRELEIDVLNRNSIITNLGDYGRSIVRLFEDLNDREGYKINFFNSSEQYIIKSLEDISPKIDSTAYIAQGAVIVGDVELKENSSVWYNAVIRADYNSIIIGKNSNVQDNAVIHLSHDSKVVIGDNVTIGHTAIVHGATIKDNVIIGMGATILDDVVIGKNTIVGANSLVTKGKVIPENSLVMGSPAKVVRELSEEEIKSITQNAISYVENSKRHRG